MLPGGRLGDSDLRDLGVGEGHPRHRGVVSASILTTQAAGNDLTVVEGEVREAADAGHIARAVHTDPRLEGGGVDLEPAALGLLQTGSLPGLEIRPSAGGDQQTLGVQGRPRLEGHDHTSAFLLDPGDWITDEHLHAVREQVWPQRDGGLRLLRAEDTWARLDHGHLRAEPRERLAELHAHGAAAQNGKRSWQL